MQMRRAVEDALKQLEVQETNLAKLAEQEQV